MYPAPSQKLTYETETAVYFYTSAFYPFENFSAHTVFIWGHLFYTAEHAFHWKKFENTNPELAEAISRAGSPDVAWKLARTSRNRRADWREVKVSIMEEIVQAKVAQHEDVRDMLLATGHKQLVENSPNDSFWGCGADGKGGNEMGKILMRLRQEFRGAV